MKIRKGRFLLLGCCWGRTVKGQAPDAVMREFDSWKCKKKK